ncbi:MAG: hypothetical protein RR555_00600 [Bacteroidales bacterium]
MKKIITLFFAISLFFTGEIFACTSAIFTGKLTPDGRPLMWKHRDSDFENNRTEYFKGEKYNFIALVNSVGNHPNEAWTGTNSVGFSIMNTASYNLKNDKISGDQMDQEGVFMYKALATCRNLSDFEKMLDKSKRPMGVEANFGVIDAQGGAAYYEVNNDSWTKIDANDPKVAPQGYIVYTNFSYSGRYNEGLGYIRYNTASKIIGEYVGLAGVITPEWIFKNLSRSFYHSVLGLDLVKDNAFLQKGSGWFGDLDFISRKSSSASLVIHGVKQGENPLNTVMWTIVGYPPIGIAVPMFVAAAENQPSFMLKSANSNNCRMCDWVLERKDKVFSIHRGNGSNYMNFNLLYNPKAKNGYMQVTNKIESKVFQMANPIIEDFRSNGFQADKLKDIYGYIQSIVSVSK